MTQTQLPFPLLDPTRVALVRVMHDRVCALWQALRSDRAPNGRVVANEDRWVHAQIAVVRAWMAAQSHYEGKAPRT